MANMCKNKLVSAVFLGLLLLTLMNIKPADSQTPIQTIFIQPDGTIYPPETRIQQNGDTYTFTDNIHSPIKIMKSNIILDGAGYILQGPYNGTQADVWVIGEGPNQLPEGVLAQYTIGIDLGSQSVEGITIQNLNVKNFSIGMYIWTKSNMVTRCAVAENIVGILLSGTNSTVTYNYITDNKRGLFFGFNNPEEIIPNDIIINHNDFENNIVQLNGCLCDDYNTTEPPHSWDDGREGNYWSDYNGTDSNNDGIGDTPYVIDVLNQDRFPLMQSPAKPPAQAPQIPLPAMILVVVTPVILIVAAAAYKRRRKV